MSTRAARSKQKPKPASAARPTPPPVAPPVAQRHPDAARDPRRWIYSALDAVFAVLYTVAIVAVIPNRLPSAAVHLWTFPIAATAMSIGMALGTREGWRIAVVSGSVMLLSTFLLIVRIVISAAFLSGVYGAFGKAAATFAIIMIAVILEVVALLPIIQVKYLMTRAGRRAYGVPAP
jgi:hypothetical protein